MVFSEKGYEFIEPTIPSLVKLIPSPFLFVQIQALYALSHIANVFPACCNAIINCGALELLESLLSNVFNDSVLLRNVGMLLAALCQMKPHLPSNKILHPTAAAININETIWDVYVNQLLPLLTTEGDDGNYVPTSTSDLQCLHVRVEHIKYDDLEKQIEDIDKSLKEAQQKPTSEASCEECIRLEKVMDDLNSKHEAHWYLRSRVVEIRDGDKNTNYFHHKASQRKRRNNIEGLYDSNGEWQEEEEKIEDIVVSYYDNLFGYLNPSDADFSQVLQHVKPVITPEHNADLMKPFTNEEIHVALKQMHPCKAPGPDDKEGRHVTSTEIASISTVHEIIDLSCLEWNENLINQFFNERDRKCIMAIPLSWRKPKDEIFWGLSSDGKYSIKTAYMWGKGCDLDHFNQAWMEIWGLEVIPKAKHFLWCLCTETLPVRSLLKHRHLIDDEICPWCNLHAETASHAIFECAEIN
ncbi:hypothetical protein POM88_011436 [Heracleum sosnowskyi]|uniref:chorismate mutase n=1 Tax=Heracleum sosnowskyi TaxID=360622 RepID=A0AAD8IYC8_9APIA|nr:hypothetical protein POM88_011436 [Heracleum sosnowskyi]